MQIETFSIKGVLRITPKQFEDARGAFSETYSKRALAEHLAGVDFVQDNFSRSTKRGTVRGLHYQLPPFAQAKLVRCTKGAIYDVAIDLRPQSPTYLQHVAAELSASNRAQLFVPQGFAHGFCTLEDDTEVQYKVDAYFSAEHDRSLSWLDAALGVNWPIRAQEATLSDKDAKAPPLSEIGAPFEGWTA